MNSDGIYYPFEVLIAFDKKAIKLQSVINYITIHCHNISKGIRIKILVTSSGNIRNQLVYVANHNKTFERHVQVSRFIWETPNIFLCIPMHWNEKCIVMVFCFITIDLINETIDHNNVFGFSLYGNEKSIVMTYCYSLLLWSWSITSLIKSIV